MFCSVLNVIGSSILFYSTTNKSFKTLVSKKYSDIHKNKCAVNITPLQVTDSTDYRLKKIYN